MSAGRGGLSSSVQARLVRHAKEVGVDPNLILTRFAVERYLYRLSRSPYSDQFILKGALLLLAWLGESLRPTRDADLLGYGEIDDASLSRIFREVCAVDVEADGIDFLAGTVQVAAIREGDTYGGRRVSLQGRLGPARVKVQVDVGIGDAVTPGPQWLEYPSLLDLPRPRLRAYPRETVVAEKLHAMVLLGARNSRMKDYFDVHALLREGAMDEQQLARAIVATFERRRTAVPSGVPTALSVAFSDDPQRESRWNAFLTKNRLQGPMLPELVREIRVSLEPVLADAHARSRTPR